MLKKISTVLAFATLLIIICLFWEHHQVWQNDVREAAFNCRVKKICFVAHGPHTYGFLADRYAYLFFLILILIAGKFIKPGLLSITICISAVGFMFFQFWQINDWYLNIIDTFTFANFNSEPNFDLLRRAAPFALFCFISSIALAGFEIIIGSRSFYQARKKLL